VISIALSGAGAEAQTSGPAGASCPAEWSEASFPRRAVPFDPLTFEAPSLHLDLMRIRERRWWAEAAVNVVVAAGLLAADQARPATEWTESFMRRPELTLGLPFATASGADGDHWRLRLQLKVKRGAPYMGVVVTW
jgi:hypothetical protein